jgi:hypothetical protein
MIIRFSPETKKRMKNFIYAATFCIATLLEPWIAFAQTSGPTTYINSPHEDRTRSLIEPPSEINCLLGAPSEQPDYASGPMAAPATPTTNSGPNRTYSKRSRFFPPENRMSAAAQLGEVDPYSGISSFSEDDDGSNSTDIASKRTIYSKISPERKLTVINGPHRGDKEATVIYKSPW